MILNPSTALTAAPSQKNTKYVFGLFCRGKVMQKSATCTSKYTKKTGNCLFSLRRHKIIASADCRIGCTHHKAITTEWLRKFMDRMGKNANSPGKAFFVLPNILRQIGPSGQPT